MKAITRQRYGSPDLLELREVPRPEPGPHEVLIKVLAAAVNKADWHILRGEPLPVRLMAGLTRPKYAILGADIAGIVERVGKEVTQFRPGEAVFGELSATGFGGFAEYVTTDEQRLARKPSNLSFEQAAALPMAAVTALQGLRDKGQIQAGQQVLINGASGGVGSYAVQIAKAYGASVTAVCSTRKKTHARELGADQVIDYKTQDFTRGEARYDLIFDVVGNHGIAALSGVLRRPGTYVTTTFSMGALTLGPWKALTTGQRFHNLLAATNPADLQHLAKLAEEEQIRPVIQQAFTLDDVPEALRLMGQGSLTGKLVITV
ncbi:MAG: NAD(P)-dependent alcohol dehydrogenase [Lewinella sp.]|nr:NAD(P)-dependent alcohol dehydrogenase [Lewinella sp.]